MHKRMRGEIARRLETPGNVAWWDDETALRLLWGEVEELEALLRRVGDQLWRVATGEGIVSVVGGGAPDEEVIATADEYDAWRRANNQ